MVKLVDYAQGDFCRALQITVDGEEFLSLTHALPGIALTLADQGEVERAVEIYTLASSMGMVANSRWFADIAGNEIAALAAGLPADVVDAAKGRVQTVLSWEPAAELLAELEELGWGKMVSINS